jgi:hypothetical protein
MKADLVYKVARINYKKKEYQQENSRLGYLELQQDNLDSIPVPAGWDLLQDPHKARVSCGWTFSC